MAQKLSRIQKQKKIVRCIRLAWSSLESHLDYSHTPEKKPCCKNSSGTGKFHADCVREYAEMIKHMADLL